MAQRCLFARCHHAVYDVLDAHRLVIMLPTHGEREVPIFTIGYGARSLDAFFAVLKFHRVAYLIDIRNP